MRKELAEVVMRMFVRVERDNDVSAKQLGSMTVGAGLTEDELAMCKLGITEYMNRRRWLKHELSRLGKSEILVRLAATNYVMWSELVEDDIDLRVGPFSYTVLTTSQNISLFDQNYSDDENGCASTLAGESVYPWSYIVIDKIGPAFAEDRLIAAIFGESDVSDAERHENMHQFEAFLQGIWGKEDKEWSCCLVADWICKRLKTELLAFLWSADIKYLERRLCGRYLSRWLAVANKIYGIDTTAGQGEKLRTLFEVAVTRVRNQISGLYNNDGYDKYAAMRMAAMMNIDRPLAEWGV